MLLGFIVFSVLLSVLTFGARNKVVTKVALVLFFSVFGAWLCYAGMHMNECETEFFRYDAISLLLGAILFVLSTASVYHSYLYLKRNEFTVSQRALYYSLFILFVTAMVSAYAADNFAVLWVSVESTTLFVAFLIYSKRSAVTLEATWKYIFVSSVGLAVAFMGILFWSIVATNNGLNSLSISGLSVLTTHMNPMWMKVAFILIVVGFSVKLSTFPLFAAAIDAKTVAPSPVNALMSTALVNVGFIGIYRTLEVVNNSVVGPWVHRFLLITAVLTVFIAAIQLTRVKRLKRMYAFSSMEHMGIVLLGLAVGGVGAYAAILHVILHSLVKAGLFFQIGAIARYYNSVWIKDMGDYFRKNPVGGLAFILGVISILAIPPSGLFVSELLTFKSLFSQGPFFVAAAVLVLLMLTFVIYQFATNALHVLYNRENVDGAAAVVANPYEHISQFVLFAGAIYLGLNPPAFLTELINAAVVVLNY